MREKPNLWRLYNSATGYGRRPSDFYELETDLAKWYLDESCLTLGRRYESEINAGRNPFGASTALSAKSYRSAKNSVKKKVKIKSDGTW